MIEGTGIQSITVPKNVSGSGKIYDSGYANGALSNNKNLNEVIFEEGMKKIPSRLCASEGKTSYIKKVVIPDTVEVIESEAFYKCKNMTIYGYEGSYAEEYALENDIPFVSVAITKNMTENQILKKLNTNQLLNNISLGSETVNGPTVTVGEKTFTLFQIPASMNLELSDKVQAKVNTEKKTIQVLIGFDKFSGSAKLDGESNSDTYWRESYKQVKSLYTGVTNKTKGTQDLYNGFRKMRSHLKKFDASMAINASTSAAGYIEFSYASGEIAFSNGGIILEANIGSEWNYPLACAPAVYVVFKMSADFNGTLSLVRQETLNYTPKIDANLLLKATIGTGVGSKNLKTYAEVGFTGGVNAGVDYVPGNKLSDTLELKLIGSMYAKGEVFGYDVYDYKYDFNDLKLYPKSKSRSRMNGANVGIEYTLEGADNSERTSNIATFSSADTQSTDNNIYVKEGVYKYCTPQMARLDDGTILLVWIDDDGSKNNTNKTSLMYSVYDGKNWSDAEKIGETGGAANYPCVYSDGKVVQIVWQKAKELKENATLPEVLETVDLYTTSYSNGKLGVTSAVTSNNKVYEMMQSAVICGNKKTIVWVENSKNDPFQISGSNCIKISTYENDSWNESVIEDDLENVRNVAVTYVNDELVVAYEIVQEQKNKIVLLQGGNMLEFEGTDIELESDTLYYESKNLYGA